LIKIGKLRVTVNSLDNPEFEITTVDLIKPSAFCKLNVNFSCYYNNDGNCIHLGIEFIIKRAEKRKICNKEKK
jgi:hypothetical protein